MSKILQISFTDSEYSGIVELANRSRLSIRQFVKGKVLCGGEFQTRYAELLDAVAAMRDGTKFNLKAIFGLNWITISKGTRLAMGKEFYKMVRGGGIPGVVSTHKDGARTQWYQKTGGAK